MPDLSPAETLAMLGELERLEREAVSVPWMAYSYEGNDAKQHRYSVCRENGSYEEHFHMCVGTARGHTEESVELNAHFIATMRNALPTLLALARRAIEMDARKFPVLMTGTSEKLRKLGCPRVVPWDFIADNDAQCKANHDQTAQRLAERGGLAPCEICAVVEGRKWRRMLDEEAVARMLELLADFKRTETETV